VGVSAPSSFFGGGNADHLAWTRKTVSSGSPCARSVGENGDPRENHVPREQSTRLLTSMVSNTYSMTLVVLGVLAMEMHRGVLADRHAGEFAVSTSNPICLELASRDDLESCTSIQARSAMHL
jgi:hypothetical protein